MAVGKFKVTYIHLLADGPLIDVIAHEYSVEDLGFSMDSSILGSGQGYYGVLLTNLEHNEELLTIPHAHNSRLAIPPDGEHIATGYGTGIVWL